MTDLKQAKLYSYNGGGQGIIIKAYSKAQAANFVGVASSTFSRWASQVKPGYKGRVDYDLTKEVYPSLEGE